MHQVNGLRRHAINQIDCILDVGAKISDTIPNSGQGTAKPSMNLICILFILTKLFVQYCDSKFTTQKMRNYFKNVVISASLSSRAKNHLGKLVETSSALGEKDPHSLKILNV